VNAKLASETCEKTVPRVGGTPPTSHPETRVVRRSTSDKTLLKQTQFRTTKGDLRGGY
jgi:hypothetical protein